MKSYYDKFVIKIFSTYLHLRGVEKKYTAEIQQFGLEVKRLREERKWTQQHLADLCEVDIRTIQRIEKGEFGVGLHIIFALADAFGFAPDLLFRNAEEKVQR